MYRHRSAAAGQDNDELSTIFQGNNDDATEAQRPIDYAAIQAVIADASMRQMESFVYRFKLLER